MRKWKAIVSIYLQEGFAYRVNGFIWILTDCVPAMIMPLVLIASMSSSGSIRGFTAGEIVAYYLMMLVVTNFVTSHFLWDLALEIKEGQFTVHLVRPVGYFAICFLRNLSWRLMRTTLFLPFLVVLIGFYWRYVPEISLHLSWQFFVCVILSHLVSFTFVLALSMLALFFQETRSIFELYYFPMLFLSGSLFPVKLLPEWAVRLAKFTPFYYTVNVPVELGLGILPASDAPRMMALQAVWIGFNLAVAKLLFFEGMKRYTAVGM
jgi:ABC-2 type transport system permease protein